MDILNIRPGEPVDAIVGLNAVSRIAALLLASAPTQEDMNAMAAIFIDKIEREANAIRRGELSEATN
jgi:hypothetical protein